MSNVGTTGAPGRAPQEDFRTPLRQSAVMTIAELRAAPSALRTERL